MVSLVVCFPLFKCQNPVDARYVTQHFAYPGTMGLALLVSWKFGMCLRLIVMPVNVRLSLLEGYLVGMCCFG